MGRRNQGFGLDWVGFERADFSSPSPPTGWSGMVPLGPGTFILGLWIIIWGSGEGSGGIAYWVYCLVTGGIAYRSRLCVEAPTISLLTEH